MESFDISNFPGNCGQEITPLIFVITGLGVGGLIIDRLLCEGRHDGHDSVSVLCYINRLGLAGWAAGAWTSLLSLVMAW